MVPFYALESLVRTHPTTYDFTHFGRKNEKSTLDETRAYSAIFVMWRHKGFNDVSMLS